MLIDLHVYNDGNLEALFASAKQRGLDGLAVLGDTSFADLLAVRDAAGNSEMLGLRGCEVETNRGRLMCFFGDIEAVVEEGLQFKAEEGNPPAASKVIAAVNEKGGVVIAAHPYYKQIDNPMGDHIFSLEGIHACEAASPLAAGMQRDLAIEASESLDLPCVGGSSARNAEHVGLAVTAFAEELSNEADLVKAIKLGHCFALMCHDEVPAEARPSAPARAGQSQGRQRRRRRGPRRD